MIQHISKTTIEPYLDNILNSEEFKSSPTNQGLLKYIVDASLAGKIPKEMDLAIDFFHKKVSFNTSEDSTVRSHVYALRKKLEKYYLTEGKDDRIRIVIPKGSYQCEFAVHEIRSSPKRSRWIVLATVTVALVASWLITFYSAIRPSPITANLQRNLPINRHNDFLSDYFESPLPTQIVLGDYFAFKERNKRTQGDRRVRDGAINSEKELEKYLQKYPEERSNVSQIRSYYLASSISKTLVGILPALTAFNRSQVFLEASSKLDAKDLEGKNVIFVGPFKTLCSLKRYFRSLSYKVHLYPHRITSSEMDSISFNRFDLSLPEDTYLRRDYAIIAKVPGESDNIIGIIAAFSPSGIIHAVEWAVGPSFKQEISREYGLKDDVLPRFFECLVKIDRLDQTSYHELIDFNPIPQGPK